MASSEVHFREEVLQSVTSTVVPVTLYLQLLGTMLSLAKNKSTGYCKKQDSSNGVISHITVKPLI